MLWRIEGLQNQSAGFDGNLSAMRASTWGRASGLEDQRQWWEMPSCGTHQGIEHEGETFSCSRLCGARALCSVMH